ncbi:MAG: TfoX/Sxy family protein [Pirellulales bacterium]|nr:TfoX/Sxy family protein [Pirellulales bacterium]
MAFDDVLADRVRPLVLRRRGFAEKKMFGGLGFLHYGNMCVGVWKEFLILRIGPDAYDETLARPYVKEFDITGRPMKGWVMVEPAGVQRESELVEWVNLAINFVSGLPRK